MIAVDHGVVAPVRRATLADLSECGAWLLTRLASDWPTTPVLALGWLRSALEQNDQAFMRCGNAFGMAHLEGGRLGAGPRIVVDFVIHEAKNKGAPEMLEIYAWMERWARGLGAIGLFRVDDFSDCDRNEIKGRLGKLRRDEVYSVMFG